MSTVEQALAQFMWCACMYTLDGLLWDDPLFPLICEARYDLGGMFP